MRKRCVWFVPILINKHLLKVRLFTSLDVRRHDIKCITLLNYSGGASLGAQGKGIFGAPPRVLHNSNFLLSFIARQLLSTVGKT